MNQYHGLVIADDLTGAADTGHEFAARDHSCVVQLDGHELPIPSPSVLVVNTDSRDCSPEEASDRVEGILRGTTANVVYKKVDSTLRGNVASEVTAALSAMGAALGIVAPAFPKNGRTTVDGQHLIDGEPVENVVESVASSDLSTLFSNDRSVVELEINVVSDGSDAVRAALADALDTHAGPLLAVCDATRDAHLDTIATGAVGLDERVVYVGSAGLARHVQVPYHNAPEPGIDRNRLRCDSDRRVLGVIGSTNPQTLDQLAALADDHVLVLDTRGVLDENDTGTSRMVDDCEVVFRDADHAVVTAARSEDGVEETLRYGRKQGLSDTEIRKRIACALATTARTMDERHAIDGFVVTGGAVATAVLSALDADGLRLLGESVGSGVPLTKIVGGSADGALVVTKAGGFGERTILRTALATLSDDVC